LGGVERKCEHCGKIFRVRPSVVARGSGRYCSQPCAHAARVIPDPTYAACHSRVYRAKGSARKYLCVSCGEPARDWAYDHDDPNELTGVDLNGRDVAYEVRYSADPEHYIPLCIPCHRVFDRKFDPEDTGHDDFQWEAA
jgi:hypothetical protein